MRNVTVALIALTMLIAAACGGGDAPTTATPALDTADATPALSIADVVAAAEAGTSNGAATQPGDGSASTGGSVTGATRTSGEDVASRATRIKLDTPERQRLVQAIQTIEALDAYEFEWSISMPSIPDVPGGLAFGGSGAIDPTNQRFSMTIDFSEMLSAIASSEDASAEELEMISAFFGDEPMEVRYIDGTTYMSWPIFGLLLGADTKWIAFEDPTGGEAFNVLPGANGVSSPLEAASLLREVWGLEEVGSETVRGVDTTHYRGVIDVTEAMGALSPDDLAALEADLNGASISDVFGEFPVDVWIDGDDVMRRFTMTIDFSGFGSAGATAEHVIGSMVMSYEFFNIGGDIAIATPPANEVTEVSDSDFLSGFDLAS